MARREQTYDNSTKSFSLGSLDLGAVSRPKRSEWVKMNLDTGAAVNTFPLQTASGERERLGFSRILRKRFAQISERKTHWCAQGVVQCCRDRVQRTTRFQSGT